MAFLAKKLFGGTNDDDDENNNEDGSGSTALTAEEIRAKRVASLQSAPALNVDSSHEMTGVSKEEKPSPAKKRRMNPASSTTLVHSSESSSVSKSPSRELSSDLSSKLNLSTPPSQKKPVKSKSKKKQSSPAPLPVNPKKKAAWEYLAIIHVFRVIHENHDQFRSSLKSLPIFSQFIDDSTLSRSTRINEETPFDLDSAQLIILERFEIGFDKSLVNLSSFKWLLQSYERVEALLKRVKETWDLSVPQKVQIEICDGFKNVITTFAGVALTATEMSQENDFLKSRHEFLDLLTNDLKGRTFPKGFLEKMVSEMDDLEDLVALIKPIFLNARKNIADNYRQSINALMKLSSIGSFMSAIIKDKSLWDPSFIKWKSNPSHSHSSLPHGSKGALSLLGIFFNISSDTPILGQIHFKGYAKLREQLKKNPANVHEIARDLHKKNQAFRSFIHSIQDGLAIICRQLIRIKSHPEVREALLEWIAFILRSNMDRGKIRYNPREVVSDGFMINLCSMLLALCGPIIRKDMKKKIDLRYFLKSSVDRTNASDEEESAEKDEKTDDSKESDSRFFFDWTDAGIARFNANPKELADIRNDLLSESDESKGFGFASSIFFLTLEGLHLGYQSALDGVLRERDHLHRTRRRVQRDPMFGGIILQRIEAIEDLNEGRITHLIDDRLMDQIHQFYNFLCTYILWLFKNDAKNSFKLVSIIPEYVIESLSKFIGLYADQQRQKNPRGRVASSSISLGIGNDESIIEFSCFFIREGTPLRSLYQKACLLETLIAYLPQFRRRNDLGLELDSRGAVKLCTKNDRHQSQTITNHFSNHPYVRLSFCIDHLVPGLIQLFRDVERTGHQGDFYERYRFRLMISQIIKFLFYFPIHSNKLNYLWKKDSDTFVGFLNMLINDLIDTLDGGLNGLILIKKKSEELKQIQASGPSSSSSSSSSSTGAASIWSGFRDDENEQKDREEKDDRETLVSQIESEKRNVKSSLSMAYSSIDLLRFLTDKINEPFFSKHILPRMALLISVYLDRLTGKAKEVKMDSETFSEMDFQPKYLLVTIVDIFLSLSDTVDMDRRKTFYEAMVSDEVQFKRSNYEKAIKFIRKHGMMNYMQTNKFEKCLNTLNEFYMKKNDLETILGDIPDKFIDPISLGLMRDPVTLPGGDIVMDRVTIERHLLNNPNNPFTREPLEKSQLIPNQDLKREIDGWIQDKIREAQSKSSSSE